MSHQHSHGHENERALWIALGLTGTYLIAEVIGGLWTGSLALLSDAGHMLTDVAALGLAIGVLRVSRRPADKKRSFGYSRYEVLGAALNAAVLLLIAVFIFIEAYHRFKSPEPIRTSWMLGIAVIGLVVNLLGMLVLKKGSAENLNMKGAYLEVWSDMLGSIGVILGAVGVAATGWLWIDPLLATMLAIWVVPRTWLLLSESINLLLEGVPPGLDLQEIEQALSGIEGVSEVHDLHVWAVGSTQLSLTAHLVISSGAQNLVVLQAVKEALIEQFEIHHSTVQIEESRCEFGECWHPSH